MLMGTLLFLMSLVLGNFHIPDSLRFEEPLKSVDSSDVLIISGGDSFQRRFTGYSRLSGDSLEALASRNGYQIVFLHQINYDKSLTYGGVKFHPNWHRIFAFPVIRSMYRHCRYFVWIDDDILAPYPETHMLNHYINDLEKDAQWEILLGEEGGGFVLNTGMIIFKNTDFALDFFQDLLDVALENDGHLATSFAHEQEAIIVLRKRRGLFRQIRAIPHRDRFYNFNTFERTCSYDLPWMRAREGDAFVHYLGMAAETRELLMRERIGKVERWRRGLPRSDMKFPIQPF